MLKDEPEDLTHLAPTAGDACIALEETTPFFSDMFDEFIMPDSYSSLLPDDISSLDSSSSSNCGGGGASHHSMSEVEDHKSVGVVPTLCGDRLGSSMHESPVSSSSSSNSINSNSSSPSPSNNHVTSNTNNNNNTSNLTDPYINYRDELSETSNSPHLLSPSGVEKVS